MNLETIGNGLAALNACLNLTSAILLLAGFHFIRKGRIEDHRRCMIGAVTAGAVFLVFYVTRFLLTGTHAFAGPEWLRPAYLTILFSHMFAAMVVAPLAIRLLVLAARERFDSHKRLARVTFPLWLYVSVTGLAVYGMLYHL